MIRDYFYAQKKHLAVLFSIIAAGFIAFVFWGVDILPFVVIVVVLTSHLLISVQLIRHQKANDGSLKNHFSIIKRKLSETQNISGSVLINSYLNPTKPIFQWGGSIISSDMGLILIDVMLTKKPKLVLECGSGISTIVTAYVLDRLGDGKVISLDHDSKFATVTRQHIEKHGLEHVAEVVYAPLTKLQLDQRDYIWYSVERLNTLQEDIDVLFVDGPPRHKEDLTRYPALPLLYSKLKKGGVVIMDDANRLMESKIIAKWRELYSFSDVYHHDTQKGTTIFIK